MSTPHWRVTVLIAITFLGMAACTKKPEISMTLDVNLYSGVPEFAKLGDSEGQLIERSKKIKPEITDIPRQVSATGEDRLSFNKIFFYKPVGMRVYMRHGRVALIELQEPFRGSIQGKKLQVFSFAAPSGESWEDALVKEFGNPVVRASGGRFGSEAFFYSWGDVSFNRMGPNELAIYRDNDLSNLRQKSFGRDVKFFQP